MLSYERERGKCQKNLTRTPPCNRQVFSEFLSNKVQLRLYSNNEIIIFTDIFFYQRQYIIMQLSVILTRQKCVYQNQISIIFHLVRFAEYNTNF